ncbi:MAG TPA: MBL fold metallo-hydrolase, partial [Myxococcota bacterium]
VPAPWRGALPADDTGDDDDAKTPGDAAERDAVIERASAALGGARAVSSARLRREVIERHQFTWGQSFTPDLPAIESGRTLVQTTIDPARGELVIESAHAPAYPYPFPAPFHMREDIDGDGRGYLRGEDDAIDVLRPLMPLRARPMSAARVAMREKLQLLASPAEIVAAARGGALDKGAHVDDIAFTWRELSFTARFDRASGRLLRVRTLEDHPLFGDEIVDVSYAEWAPTSLGTIEPARVVHRVDGRVVVVDRVLLRERKVERPDVPRVPAAVGPARAGLLRAHFMLDWMGYGFPQDDAATATKVTFTEVAPGIHEIAGAFHNSLAIELDDERLLLVEAPLSTERVDAIFAALSQRFPKQRVTAVVQTHWHHDHSAGLRSVVARGIPIYAGALGADLVRTSAARPRTLWPDALASQPMTPDVRLVDGTGPLVVDGKENRVEIWPLASIHARDMLAVYVPKAKLLYVVDVLNPGMATPSAPLRAVLAATVPFVLIKAGAYAHDVDAFLRTHDVAVIVGGHGDRLATPDDVAALLPYGDAKALDAASR